MIACKMVIAAICALGIWSSWQLLRADYIFRQGTEESVRKAISIEPDAWGYYTYLAQLDDAHAQQLLESAIKLDPYSAEAHIELGLRLEAAGDYAQAEKSLLDAYAVDRTFVPRWSLANFYFRRGDLTQFWAWAKRAAEMPSESTAPLFELCWRASPDPTEISNRILTNDPALIRQFLGFLLTKNELPAAAETANRLAQFGDPGDDNPIMFHVIERLIAAGNGEQAKALWNDMSQKHWIVADGSAVNNPSFARDPLPMAFDWSLPAYPGLHSWPGPAGLESEFSGDQPETCTVTEQTVVLTSGNYEIDYSYRTEGIPANSGLRWQVIAAGSDAPLAESSDLSSDSQSHGKVAFSVPPGTSLFHLRLEYRRALGTSRISGNLVVASIQILAKP